MKTLKNYITESTFKTIGDLNSYLDKFKDDETSWRGATDEVMDLARYSREFLEEFDNIKVDAIEFKKLKTPAEWNKTAKQYILANIEKMSETAQQQFLKHINGIF